MLCGCIYYVNFIGYRDSRSVFELAQISYFKTQSRANTYSTPATPDLCHYFVSNCWLMNLDYNPSEATELTMYLGNMIKV